MSGQEEPQQSHYLAESQAPDCGGNCSAAGWGSGLYKGRCPQCLSTGTPHQGKQQAVGYQHSQRKVQIQVDAIWSQNVPGCVSDEDGPHHGKVPRSDKHS